VRKWPIVLALALPLPWSAGPGETGAGDNCRVEKDSGWSPWSLAIQANRKDEAAAFAYVTHSEYGGCRSAAADRR
jgi:hypothetical protein